jgi:hypothetical protein
MAIGKKLRFEVFKRDAFRCQYCGRTPPAVTLEVDHVHPESKGGCDDIDNLLTSCFDCNRGKRDGLLSSVPMQLSEKMAIQQDRAEQLEDYNKFLIKVRKQKDKWCDAFGDKWYQLCGFAAGQYGFEEVRAVSIRKFLDQLPPEEIMEAIVIAHDRKPATRHYDLTTWKYFCGICWNKIKRATREVFSHG